MADASALATVLACMMFIGCGAGTFSIEPNLQSTPPSLATPTPYPENRAGGKEAKMDIEELAKKIERTDPTTASLIRAKGKRNEQMATPFLQKGSIFRVQADLPTRPVIFYIGCPGEGDCTVLNGDDGKFTGFVGRAGLSLISSSDRLEYVRLYLAAVAAPAGALTILDDIGGIRRRPNLSDADNARFDEIQKKFSRVVVPPKCSGTICTLFTVKGRDLVRFDADVASDGSVSIKENVLESGLPIPYAM